MSANPTTGTLISGQTEGGFRYSNETQGAPLSSHKEGKGADIKDADGWLDDWLTDRILEDHQLYREAAVHTPRWAHLTTRPPGSGNRSFTI